MEPVTRSDPPVPRARSRTDAGPATAAAGPRRAVDVEARLPVALRLGTAVAWRLIVMAVAVYLLYRVMESLVGIVLPVGIALLLAALLSPAVSRLDMMGVPRALAVAAVLVLGLGALGAILTFVVLQFVDGLPALRAQVTEAIDQVNVWLSTGPLQLSDGELQGMLDRAKESIQGNQDAVASHVLHSAMTLGHLLTAAVLTIFTLIFFLYDGERIWRFLTRLAPVEHRDRVDVAGRRGFAALVSYIRATVVVALIDALLAGVGFALVGLPLAAPLAALVFLGAFVPILGAFVAGAVAVLVALVAQGWISALVVLGILLAIAEIEGHVLNPLLLGRAVHLHPLAVVLAIGVGLAAAGIPGAVLSVPLLAVLNASIRSLRSPGDDAIDPERIDVNDDCSAEPEPASAPDPART
jgi:putative heme transporter